MGQIVKTENNWKDIPGYGGKYQASIDGRVRRVYKSGKTRLMTPYRKTHKAHRNKVFVKLTINGKPKEVSMLKIMVDTFFGQMPPGKVAYRKDGCPTNNAYWNIGFTDRQTLGRMTGARSRRMPVVKISREGEIVDFYKSAREAARKNHMSYQTVLDRCNNKIKNPFALDGHNYQFEV